MGECFEIKVLYSSLGYLGGFDNLLYAKLMTLP